MERKEFSGYHLRLVEAHNEIVELYEQFHLLFSGEHNSEKSQKMICVLEKQKKAVGLLTGKFDVAEKQFWILMCYIKKEERTEQLLCRMIEQFLEMAEERFSPQIILWKYELADLQRDPYQKIIRQIPGLEMTVQEVSKSMRVLTDQFYKHRHGEKFYGLSTLERKGFEMKPWKECGESIKNQFLRIQDQADEELMELLPFVGEDYDPDNSMVLLEKKSGNVCAWMICRKISEKEVEIRRWYTLEEYRESAVGLIFGAYMLKRLGGQYGIYRFQMRSDNESMKGFTGKYFRNAIVDEKYTRCLKISKCLKSVEKTGEM